MHTVQMQRPCPLGLRFPTYADPFQDRWARIGNSVGLCQITVCSMGTADGGGRDDEIADLKKRKERFALLHFKTGFHTVHDATTFKLV